MNKDIKDYAEMMWKLIMSDDPDLIASLERKLETTQSEAVDEYIENSCWSEDLPHLIGHKGTPVMRREALRAAYWADFAPPARIETSGGSIVRSDPSEFTSDGYSETRARSHASGNTTGVFGEAARGYSETRGYSRRRIYSNSSSNSTWARSIDVSASLDEALERAHEFCVVYERDGVPAALRAAEELASILRDGFPYDPISVMDWMDARAELALIGLEALELLRTHRPRK